MKAPGVPTHEGKCADKVQAQVADYRWQVMDKNGGPKWYHDTMAQHLRAG